jgi:hypothetical protein
MKTIKNLIIIASLLALVCAIAYGILQLAKKENNQQRYSHPVSRKNASW